MNSFSKKLTLTACFVLTVWLTAASHADWPQFRGQRVDGKSRQPSLLARVPTAQLKIRWRKKIGSGYSSVATLGNRAVTSYDNGNAIYLVCFSIDSGKVQWKTRIAKNWRGHNGAHPGPIATPALGFGKAFMLTPEGRFMAVGLAKGDIKWSIDVDKGQQAKPQSYGYGSSPTIWKKHVLLQLGPPAGTLCAFEPDSGKVAWSYGQDAVGYQTPVPMKIDDTELILAAGATNFFGFDPASQKMVFEREHQGKGGRGAVSLAAVPFGEQSVLLTHDDTRSKAITINRSAAIPKNETTPLGTQDAWNTKAIWESTSVRNSYNIPIAVGDHLYAFSSRVLTCIDADAKTSWRSRQPGDGFLSEVDGHLIAMTKNGTLHIIKATPDAFYESAQLKVFDDISWSIPAIHGDSILIRSMGEIACVDLVVQPKQEIVKEETVAPGPEFQKFLDAVSRSNNKTAVVDQFLEKLPSTPLVERNRVCFLLRGDYTDVAVGGDLFGARQEKSMSRIPGTDLFFRVARVPKNARLNYVFVADYQTITDPLNANQSTSSLFVEDIELAVLVEGKPLEMSWFDTHNRSQPPNPGPNSILNGKLEKLSLVSETMGKQKIEMTVYTPPGYAKQKGKLPVIFFHEANAAIEKGHIDRILDQKMSQGRIRDFVVVYIHYEFDPTLGAPTYETMFGKELVPLIDSKYRVSQDRKSRWSVAGGFSGVIALTTGLVNRKTIGQIGVLGLHHFHVHRTSIGNCNRAGGPACKIRIQTGSHELRNPDENWNMSVLAKEVVEYLNKNGHSATLQTTNGGTDWNCWALAVESLLNDP